MCLMITASTFKKYPSDYDWSGHPYYAAEFPQTAWGVIGSLYGYRLFDHVVVLWLSTLRNRRPSDRWLEDHFPTLDELTTGFRLAFEEYRTNWCGEQMRSEMLGAGSPNVLQL